MLLDSSTTKFQVKVSGRVVAETTSRAAADVIVSQLSESERPNAVVIPVVGSNQVLLG